MPANGYSSTWFDTFLADFPPAQTEREIAFIASQMPLPAYQQVLDIGCGLGRHAIPLAEKGYQVTGIDVNSEALSQAQQHPQITYRHHDMRHINQLNQTFDAALLLWQSFGYFDPDTNADILKQISESLRPRGRFILDIYHHDFFKKYQGTREIEKDGQIIIEDKVMRDDRLTVTLTYADGTGDLFDWQLFTPESIQALAQTQGLNTVAACTGFDLTQPTSADSPRMQLIFGKD